MNDGIYSLRIATQSSATKPEATEDERIRTDTKIEEEEGEEEEVEEEDITRGTTRGTTRVAMTRGKNRAFLEVDLVFWRQLIMLLVCRWSSTKQNSRYHWSAGPKQAEMREIESDDLFLVRFCPFTVVVFGIGLLFELI